MKPELSRREILEIARAQGADLCEAWVSQEHNALAVRLQTADGDVVSATIAQAVGLALAERLPTWIQIIVKTGSGPAPQPAPTFELAR